LDKDNLCQSTEIDEHNISNSDLDSNTPRIKNKNIVKKEYNSDSDDTKHIVSDEPNTKKKKVMKKEYNLDIVSDKSNIKNKKIVKKGYISDNDN
jgi:hypothetical protein